MKKITLLLTLLCLSPTARAMKIADCYDTSDRYRVKVQYQVNKNNVRFGLISFYYRDNKYSKWFRSEAMDYLGNKEKTLFPREMAPFSIGAYGHLGYYTFTFHYTYSLSNLHISSTTRDGKFFTTSYTCY